jgi:hypothetical protein
MAAVFCEAQARMGTAGGGAAEKMTATRPIMTAKAAMPESMRADAAG